MRVGNLRTRQHERFFEAHRQAERESQGNVFRSYVDVDNQYITMPAFWTLTSSVPWDATCEGITTSAIPCGACSISTNYIAIITNGLFRGINTVVKFNISIGMILII
jgi:hypothetical protein